MSGKHGLGCKPDLPCTIGDWPKRAMLGALRQSRHTEVDLRKHLADIPIADQGLTQSCVGHSMAAAIALQLRVNAGQAHAPLPSALHIYDMARGHDRVDNGTTLFSAADAVSRFGWLAEAELPWDSSAVVGDRRPTWGKSATAYTRRGTKHHRLYVADKGILSQAVAAGLGVVVGCTVGDVFQDLTNGDIYYGESQYLGSHAMAVVGYTKDAVIVRNSWGADWGHYGHGLISWGFIQNPAQTHSVWIIDATVRGDA